MGQITTQHRLNVAHGPEVVPGLQSKPSNSTNQDWILQQNGA